MRRLYKAIVLMISIAALGAQIPCAQPLWSVDLAAKYGLRAFGLPKHERNHLPSYWKLQQGIVFVTPHVLAVYQVLENSDLNHLQRKDVSGGSGRYVLQVSVMDATDGQGLKTLQLVTSGSGSSNIYPTHDGKLLVRTGEIIRVYSPAFEETAIAHLPHSQTANSESSKLFLSPSGKIVHVSYTASYSSQIVAGETLLDADTLDPIPEPPPGEEGSPEIRPGFTFFAKDNSCPSKLVRTSSDTFVGYGCKTLQVLGSDGRLRWDIPMHEEVVAVRGYGTLMAAAIQRHRPNPLDLDLAPEPLRIEIYDLGTKSEKCSIPRLIVPTREVWPSMLFAISSSGAVAVIQGTNLSFYEP